MIECDHDFCKKKIGDDFVGFLYIQEGIHVNMHSNLSCTSNLQYSTIVDTEHLPINRLVWFFAETGLTLISSRKIS